ncbi:MAG: LacI family transcriptional regulator [Gammaproteobacteria bacterium]|nr:LacI family transcriptional regulator [Gammaproteobacteria bacterium]
MSTKQIKATSIDIAHRANVSQATVSRALRNSPLVRPETRLRIQQIANEMHYRVDRSAAGLRTRRSRTLALLLFEEYSNDAQINPFFLNMLGHITRTAARRGFDLLVSFQQHSEDWHSDYELSNRADGLILLGYGDYTTYADRLRRLTDSGANFVIWGPVIEDLHGHYLGCDNEFGTRRATEHLLNLGRRQIAFAGGASEQCPEFLQRHRGYETTLRAVGIEPNAALRVDAQSTPASGYQAGLQLVHSGQPFDAVIAASDLIAIGVIRALMDHGLRVPEDVSVVGFDDIVTASYYNPPLSTVRQDTRRAGERLVDNLIELIQGGSVQSTLIEPELVIRGSCGGQPSGSTSSTRKVARPAKRRSTPPVKTA